MITLFTGLPGSGKSYKMVAELWKHKNKYFVIHNVVGFKTEKLKEYGFNWVDYCTKNNISVEEFFSKDYQIELAKKVKEKYNRQMLIIIDEAHEWFDRNVKALKMWLSYHRHINQQIYLVAHATKNIPQTYRTFVEVEYRAKSSSFIFLPGYFFYNRIIGGQRAGYVLEKKKQEIFNLYSSHDITGTEKKRVSALIPGIILLIMVLLVLFVKTPSFIWGKKEKTESGIKTESQVGVGANNDVQSSENAVDGEINKTEGKIPFDEKYAFVGQINGMVIIEDRKNGIQYMLHRVPGNFRVLEIKRADYCIVWNGRDKIYTLRNFDRYVGHNDLQPVNITPSAGPEVRQQSTDWPGVDG